MRKRIRVLIKSDSPLAISESFKGNWAVPTKDYIPGSAVRGALASYLIKSIGLKEMKEMLLSPGTAVLDFHPVNMNSRSRIHNHGHDQEKENQDQKIEKIKRIIETGRLPRTVVSCKRRHGVLGEESSDGLENHGLADSLEAVLVNLLKADAQREKSRLLTLRCKKCREQQKEFEGWYQLEKREKGGDRERAFSFKGISPTTASYVHIGIDPDRGASAPEIFYTIDALDEEQFFLGTILVDDLDDQAVKEWRKILDQKPYLFLGGGKSRGYGAARIIEVVPEETERKGEGDNPLQPPEIRCQIFTERIKDKGGFIEEGCWLVPLTLLSPSILMDRFLRPVVDDLTKDVRDHGLPTTGKPFLVKADTETVQGWHSAANVPKPDFWAVTSGSVFVYQCPATEQTVRALYRIEEMGIGFRRAEGFGRVRVASPLHTGILDEGSED